jgi:hypothetical protein
MKLNGNLLILDSKAKDSKHTLFIKLKHKLKSIHRITNILFKPILISSIVVTLALGSRLRQGFARLWAKREAESHTTYSQECEKV